MIHLEIIKSAVHGEGLEHWSMVGVLGRCVTQTTACSVGTKNAKIEKRVNLQTQRLFWTLNVEFSLDIDNLALQTRSCALLKYHVPIT